MANIFPARAVINRKQPQDEHICYLEINTKSNKNNEKKLQNAECRLQHVIYVSDAERTWNLLLVRTVPKQFLQVCFSECYL